MLKTLSVAESGYVSDVIIGEQTNYNIGSRKPVVLRILINDKKTCIIRKIKNNQIKSEIEFSDIDIDGLIRYLGEVKNFLDDQKVVNLLKGDA